MQHSSKPEIHALLAMPTRSGVATKIVKSSEVKSWAKFGWKFVAYDPDDEAKLAKWLENEGVQ